MRKFLILVCGSLFITGPCYAGKMIWKTPSDPGRAYPKFHIGVSGINDPKLNGTDFVDVKTNSPSEAAADLYVDKASSIDDYFIDVEIFYVP